MPPLARTRGEQRHAEKRADALGEFFGGLATMSGDSNQDKSTISLIADMVGGSLMKNMWNFRYMQPGGFKKAPLGARSTELALYHIKTHGVCDPGKHPWTTGLIPLVPHWLYHDTDFINQVFDYNGPTPNNQLVNWAEYVLRSHGSYHSQRCYERMLETGFPFYKVPVHLRLDGKLVEISDLCSCCDETNREILEIAMIGNWMTISRAPEYLRNNREFMEHAIAQHYLTIHFASEELKNNREFMRFALSRQWEVIRHLNKEMLYDTELLKIAVKRCWKAIQYVPDALRANKEFMRFVARQGCEAMYYAPTELLSDRSFMEFALAQDWDAVCYASIELRDDKDFMEFALSFNWNAIVYASTKLRNNREFVKMAMTLNGEALYYASDEIKSDKEFMKIAILNDCNASRHISKELKKDKDFMSFVNEVKVQNVGSSNI